MVICVKEYLHMVNCVKLWIPVRVCTRINIYVLMLHCVCVCACVCVRERERERVNCLDA